MDNMPDYDVSFAGTVGRRIDVTAASRGGAGVADEMVQRRVGRVLGAQTPGRVNLPAQAGCTPPAGNLNSAERQGNPPAFYGFRRKMELT